MEFPSVDWFQRLRDNLNADGEFRQRARYLSASFQLGIGTESFTVDVTRGEIVGIHSGEPLTGGDFAIVGPLEEWRRLLVGEIDLPHATNPVHGKLRIRGNIIAAAGNMWALYGLCQRFASVG